MRSYLNFMLNKTSCFRYCFYVAHVPYFSEFYLKLEYMSHRLCFYVTGKGPENYKMADGVHQAYSLAAGIRPNLVSDRRTNVQNTIYLSNHDNYF